MTFTPFRQTAQVLPPAVATVDDAEVFAKQLSFGQIGEFPVCKTSKRWRGIDVYVTAPAGFFVGPFGGDVQPSIGVLVYGVVRGVRALVGSGRYSLDDAGDTKWTCAVHDCGAEAFEVALAIKAGPGTFSTTASVQVSVIASNDAPDVPDALGAIRMMRNATMEAQPSISVLTLGGQGIAGSGERFQLVAVNAVSSTSPRYLHIFDTVGVPANGATPLMAWSIPNVVNAGAQGSSVFDVNPMMRRHKFASGIAAAISTTPVTLTLAAANDCAFQVYYR